MKPHSFLFLGTGPSNGIPDVTCLTADPPTCAVCLAATQPAEEPRDGRMASQAHARVGAAPLFNKNRRGNTSGVLRLAPAGGGLRHVLLDCGKTFYAAALAWFARVGVRRIDAVLLTHDHADAILGLDDLRAWTLNGKVQQSINVFLSQRTLDVVKRVFPYMVDAAVATGGGHLPALEFIVFEENKPFSIPLSDSEHVPVVPFLVEHGRKGNEPYYCNAFQLPGLTYISDASRVPEQAKNLIRNDGNVLVLDCLREKDFASHMGYESAIPLVFELAPKRVFFMGLNDELDHYEFEGYLEKQSGFKERGIEAAVAFDGLMITL
ncbi:beta-lactamase-like protein [Obelidium mucronatum]|nr:beta-lactamase-like protein [Obelidium mucronatum]